MELQPKFDIVDTQVHIGPGKIEETLTAMDALGIRSILIDEYWLEDFFSYHPHHNLNNGEIRPVCPTAELAAQMYPDRFSWVLRVNRNDPEYGAIIRMVKDSPYGRAIRIIPGMNPVEIKAFVEGGYNHILEAVSESGLPLCLYLPDQPDLIARTAQKFPELKIIVDHCGLYNNQMRTTLSGGKPFSQEEQLEMFDRVLALSEFCNIALKWAHYSTMFGIPSFPGRDLQPVLRKAISAFGADRILWASDFSVNQMGENWGEILYGVKGNAELSQQELAALLGENARRWFNWPAK
ncbi:amidohydrolase family protein [Alkaliphilus crotonatoxidans]